MKKENIHELINQYFEGTLSREEERELLALLLEYPEADPEAEEALAVMTLTHMPAAHSGRTSRKPIARSRWWKNAAAAAAVIAIGAIGITAMSISDNFIDKPQKMAVAYVKGEKIENKDKIRNIISGQLNEISFASAEVSMEVTGDLDDIRNALNMEDL